MNHNHTHSHSHNHNNNHNPAANPNAHHQADLKRKRSPSHDGIHPASAPLPKTAKTHNHLQINYLARQLTNDLPLITNDDTLPNILSLLSDYQGVLDRHESMACNLGARPLGPILIKRFERLFDGPPRVLKSHGKDGINVTWLDVVEFARNKPEQFHLAQMSEGARVCQFYTKQCRVQISEEDFVLISSGIPQKMIPPQPIVEDEEKELGTLDILEKNLGQVCQLADQVAARTRQLNHRLKGRKQAIIDRRATATAPPAPSAIRPSSPSNVALMNGAGAPTGSANMAPSSQTSPGGFVAVNRAHSEQNGNGASQTTRHELMSKFHTLTDRRASSQPTNGGHEVRRPSSISQQSPPHQPAPVPNASKPPPGASETGPSNLARPPQYSDSELQHMMNSPVPIPNTPSSLLPAASQRVSQPQEKDDGGPFKAEMVQRMESLAKGERILPPCDRCRRLHMDCLKNLTACMGCTKKHAKCSWKEVREPELRASFSHHINVGGSSGMHSEGETSEGGDRASTGSPSANIMSPPRQGMTPKPNLGAPPQHGPLAPLHEPRPMSSRPSPPVDRERERERGVEVQLQEAAKSGLAHANARLPPQGDHQTMVA
ncbi:hypothetical protein BU24DRAFT_355420 [Aaosphaeria arxii CBS 175.79]|uniref:Zn(2)-C6 fungal-type domain-containing protein n=1 Tax=Aaosphaeria arxii CBS 175.79 TaxID=1450172 RepID=A0A6A5XDJ1_9PLEO|nr:uncharacterized protein BU24DRAFT_355420 [Aaosphaeria arxii CBS 175.79]KAF2010886.1 hypothetical protein BU24DRAFT_355420 [Aaosphaeria arxii CBS 175.79]